MVNFSKKQPEKVFQTYNGFKFDFYRDSIDKCGVIDNECRICGGKMKINNNGYEDVTDVHAQCPQCGFWQNRYVKYSEYTSSRSYESQAVVKKYDDGSYLDIYNIR